MKIESFAFTLMFFAVRSLFLPDVFFFWRDITTGRRR